MGVSSACWRKVGPPGDRAALAGGPQESEARGAAPAASDPIAVPADRLEPSLDPGQGAGGEGGYPDLSRGVYTPPLRVAADLGSCLAATSNHSRSFRYLLLPFATAGLESPSKRDEGKVDKLLPEARKGEIRVPAPFPSSLLYRDSALEELSGRRQQQIRWLQIASCKNEQLRKAAKFKPLQPTLTAFIYFHSA